MDNLKKVLAAGLAIRIGAIAYGQWHDEQFEVPFTDVDYKVFTDAARHVTQGSSPYNRYTYRYPPLLAWILVPNIYLFPAWGKLLFSVIDVFVGVIVHALVTAQGSSPQTSLRCAMVWVFNPLAIVIAARGNSDSIIALTVLLSALLLLKNKPALTGVFLALAIHIRLYPIVFSLPMYLALSSDKKVQHNSTSSRIHRYLSSCFHSLWPNRQQAVLALSCIASLAILTMTCFYLYGYQYLDESILYHIRRRDTRHNFSVYFYLLYLNPSQPSLLIFLPQFLILLSFCITYGNKSNLLFCLFVQTFVIVSYNSVLTSQYFVWYLSLLPPVLPRLKMHLRQGAVLTSLWVFAQLAWLVPAYLLEFRGKDTFLFIWFQGIGFFCANVAILVRLIRGYLKEVKIQPHIKED